MRKNYKIAIVGGSGFIGSSLARHISGDFRVRVLDKVPPQRELLSKRITYRRLDIRDYDEVAVAVEDVDLVIHAAIVQIPMINEEKKLGYEVNVIGTQNVCRAVDESSHARGMILAGSWHVMGERGLEGVIDESFGFRPDKVEDRARLYVLSKTAQEAIVRFYNETSEKIYGIIRMGTVLGEEMPEKTAANIFIKRGLKERIITPYNHSMHRPMLYVDINDVCRAFEACARKILDSEIKKNSNSLAHTVNVYYPKPITILELAEIVRDTIARVTEDKVSPRIMVVDQGIRPLFHKDDKLKIKVDLSKAFKLLRMDKLTHPRESIERIVRSRLLRG